MDLDWLEREGTRSGRIRPNTHTNATTHTDSDSQMNAFGFILLLLLLILLILHGVLDEKKAEEGAVDEKDDPVNATDVLR
ncbi:hypothetical protein AOQ84DRAFT_380266 [Glonium stellatum]|uniref:Uncharacterized protein n=1 Tax=Glonium stellatum TaxID=574774 RepID=A0A8E2EUV2_9PEZI|nr:hypothetical protein AOQ84DRAFT_380266 [Glonium stellatum]